MSNKLNNHCEPTSLDKALRLLVADVEVVAHVQNRKLPVEINLAKIKNKNIQNSTKV